MSTARYRSRALSLAWSVCALIVLPVSPAFAGANGQTIAPAGDHHTHLLGPAAVDFLAGVGAIPAGAESFTADALVEAMDSARIDRATVASVGYFFTSSLLPAPLDDVRSLLQE